MADQPAAAAPTAAGVIAAILAARPPTPPQGGRAHPARAARPPRQHSGTPRSDKASPSPATLSDDASCAVREAEQHVHNCWQQLQTRIDPPE